jgi:hypothetical protein
MPLPLFERRVESNLPFFDFSSNLWLGEDHARLDQAATA